MARDEQSGALIDRFRAATDADRAFDRLAAERLGVSVTDLRCLTIVESRNGLTAGALATASGLTTGAVTAVVDRLERAGHARRAYDPRDRRKVNVEVTSAFHDRAREIWGPFDEDWQDTLGEAFTAEEHKTIARFLAAAAEIARRQAERLRGEEVPR